MTPVWFALAAALGTLVRHRVNELGLGSWGTLAVNVVGAFLLGWILGSEASSEITLVAGTAFCGSLTTFSTFSLEATEGTMRERITVITATLVLGIVAATAGYAIG